MFLGACELPWKSPAFYFNYSTPIESSLEECTLDLGQGYRNCIQGSKGLAQIDRFASLFHSKKQLILAYDGSPYHSYTG